MFLVVILTLNVQSLASYAIPLKVPLWWSHVQPQEPLARIWQAYVVAWSANSQIPKTQFILVRKPFVCAEERTDPAKCCFLH